MIYRSESKFKNKKVRTEDGVFDSKHELARWRELKLLERAGEIHSLRRQVGFVLVEKSECGRQISYIADFVYLIGLRVIVEDAKSKATMTPLYRLKKRLLAEKYGIIIKEIY